MSSNGDSDDLEIEIIIVGGDEADALNQMKATVLTTMVTLYREQGADAVTKMLEEAGKYGIEVIPVTVELVKVLSNCMKEARGI